MMTTTSPPESDQESTATEMSDVDLEATIHGMNLKRNSVESTTTPLPQPQPLWPKTLDEYGWAVLDMGVLGMVIAGMTGKCPSIPSLHAFLISFAAVTLIANGHKFVFSLRRPNQHKLYPRAKKLMDVLGLAQLGIGVWGMALIFPNLDYLKDPSPDTCEMGPLIATLIPSCIIALVIIGLLGMGILHLLGCKRFITPDEEKVEESKLVTTNKASEDV